MGVEEPLRVAVAAWTYVPGKMGGTETYAREMLRHLALRDDVDVRVLVPRSGRGLGPSDRELVGDVEGGDGSVLGRLGMIARALRPDPATREELVDADVVLHPFTVPVPFGRGPRVQVVHDVQHRDLPSMFSLPERAYRAAAYDAPARRAAAVLTLSRFSRERIIERLGVPAERVHVAHLGVDRDAFEASGERESYVLYPAHAWPHKNHARLIAAMGLVRRTRPDLRLVLTGGGASALGDLPSWVEDRGRVSEDELRRLYSRAACLAYPSLYEGFGLPPVEAMASGCPVTASTSGAVPEVCGDAAVLVDATDVDALARGVESALDHAPRLVARGYARVRELTWEACAAAHVEVFSAISQGRVGALP